jgi:release factor glutamine methyltransferase
VRTLGEVLRLSTAHLERHGSPTARLDAELLLGHALGLGRVELYTGFERPLSEEELARCRELVARRAKREPVAYILGRWGFRGLDLDVDPRVLVPRPETELLVDRCLALLDGVAGPDVLDVGTGSGAIALALADEHPGARVLAIDSSVRALAVAERNARRLGLDVGFALHDVQQGLPGGPFDLVVCNPPYVSAAELARLDPEVRDWEPPQALVDEGQSLAVVRAARGALRRGGWLVLECHEQKAGELASTLAEHGYTGPLITDDLAGRPRVVEAQWQR